MNSTNIAFIGGGNMARSLVGGLVQKGFTPNNIIVSDPNEDLLAALQNDFHIQITHHNREAVSQAQLIVLAVKPQVIKKVCLDLAPFMAPDVLVVSIAAGINCHSLAQWLGDKALVRAMPNTPALIQAGATGAYANAHTTAQQRALADTLLSAIGLCEWIEQEALIDAVTAVSGSGPAYFFLLIEAMVNAAEAQGLDRALAHKLAVQTALGAAQLAQFSGLELAELRRRVTSPGGTTEQAIATFEAHNLRQTVAEAMTACADRARELAVTLGQ